MKTLKKIQAKIILGLILLIVIGGFLFYLKLETNRKVQAFSDTVEEKVARIAELSTIQYHYTDVLTYKENISYKGLSIPFTGKSFLIKYTGYIKAGIDLETIDIDVVDTKRIVVKIKGSQILDNVINEEDIYVYDERESVFNRLKISDVYDVLVKEKKKTEQEIIERGFLDEADANASAMIEEFLRTMGFSDIRIEIRKAD